MSTISAQRYALELEDRAISRLLSNLAVEKHALRIAELRYQNASRPINVLPDVILGDIFQDVLNGALTLSLPVPATSNLRNRTLATLMATCHRWLVVCLGRSRLWSHIFVTPFVSVEKIQIDIQRAQNAPLDLTIIPGPTRESPPQVSKMIDPVPHRCRNLQVRGRIGDTKVIFPIPCMMPLLQSIHLTWELRSTKLPDAPNYPSRRSWLCIDRTTVSSTSESWKYSYTPATSSRSRKTRSRGYAMAGHLIRLPPRQS